MTDQTREPAPAISAAEVLAKTGIHEFIYKYDPERAVEYAGAILKMLRVEGFALVPIDPDDAAVERAADAISQFHPTFRHKVRAALRSYTGGKDESD